MKVTGFEDKIKDGLEHLLGELVGERKEKARDAVLNLYRFLHLGPHDHTAPNQPPDDPQILRRDARFALLTTMAVFEYVTPPR